MEKGTVTGRSDTTTPRTDTLLRQTRLATVYPSHRRVRLDTRLNPVRRTRAGHARRSLGQQQAGHRLPHTTLCAQVERKATFATATRLAEDHLLVSDFPDTTRVDLSGCSPFSGWRLAADDFLIVRPKRCQVLLTPPNNHTATAVAKKNGSHRCRSPQSRLTEG